MAYAQVYELLLGPTTFIRLMHLINYNIEQCLMIKCIHFGAMLDDGQLVKKLGLTEQSHHYLVVHGGNFLHLKFHRVIRQLSMIFHQFHLCYYLLFLIL